MTPARSVQLNVTPPDTLVGKGQLVVQPSATPLFSWNVATPVCVPERRHYVISILLI